MFCFCFGCAAARNGSEEFDDVVGVGEGRNNATNNNKKKRKKQKKKHDYKKSCAVFCSSLFLFGSIFRVVCGLCNTGRDGQTQTGVEEKGRKKGEKGWRIIGRD